MTVQDDKKQDGKVEDETVETQESKGTEKMLTQTEVNALLAKEKRDWQNKLNTVQTEYSTYKTEVEGERSKQEEKLKTQVEDLRKGIPEQLIKLLDKLTISEQYEYLTDPENKIEKPILPNNPKEKGDGKPVQKIGIIF